MRFVKHHTDEDALRRLVTKWRGQGETWKAIAEYLECSEKTIKQRGKLWGLVDPKKVAGGLAGSIAKRERQGVSHAH